jgi:hypothetical protein
MDAIHLSRRDWLAIAGVSCGAVLASAGPAAKANDRAKAKSVIMIFNCGAPSHIDLWDPKPDAAANIRGEFQTIATQTPGIFVTDIIPEIAKRTNKMAIVRSVHHAHGGHNSGMYWTIVGRPYRMDSTLINPSATDYPSFGTLTGWLAMRDGYNAAVPPYVIVPFPHCDSKVYITPGQYGGCLGLKYDPFVVNANPNAKDFSIRDMKSDKEVSQDRLQQRLGLLDQFNSVQKVSTDAARDQKERLAQPVDITLSGDAASAFDLSQESTAVRDRYGRHEWGQSHLLARRLVERGSRFVSVVNGPSITWDTHADNFGRMKKQLVPPMETAYCALLDDLEERGMLDSTMVVWMGDFGRTPMINNQAGRDHWPQCYTTVLAGGGIRGGQVIGSSDKTGAFPATRPVTPADIHATVFTALGYDPHRIVYHTADGRPTPLSEGEAISELL